MPNSSRLNQHQGAAQDSKLLSAETSWEKAAGGEAGRGYPAPSDPEPGPTRPCRVTRAPWTAASLVLLFTGIEEEGTAEKWLAHVSVRSDAQGVVAPRREAAAEP